MRSPALFLVLMSLTLLACQSAPGQARATRPDPDRISQEEIETLENHLVMNAREVIRRLRPAWLRPRGSSPRSRHTPMVFQDGQELGGLEVLDDMDMRHIHEIRYLSGPDATNRYGSGYPGGIIQLFTRR